MTFAKQKFLIVVGLLALPFVTLLAFVETPHVSGVVLNVALKVARFRTGLRVSARSWDVSPFAFSASLKDLEVISSLGRLAAPTVSVRLSPVALFLGRAHLSRVEIDSPIVVVNRRFDLFDKQPDDKPFDWREFVESNFPRRMGEEVSAGLEYLRKRNLGIDDMVVRDLRFRMAPLSVGGATITASNLQEGQIRLEWELRNASVLGQLAPIDSLSGSLSLLRSEKGNFSLVLSDVGLLLDRQAQALNVSVRGSWPGELITEVDSRLKPLLSWLQRSPVLGITQQKLAGTIRASMRLQLDQKAVGSVDAKVGAQDFSIDDYFLNDVDASFAIQGLNKGKGQLELKEFLIGLPYVKGDRKEWKHRISIASFSMSENKLEAVAELHEAGLCGIIKAAGEDECQVGVSVSGKAVVKGSLSPLNLEIRPEFALSGGPIGSDPFIDPTSSTVVTLKPGTLKGGLAVARDEILDLKGMILSWADGSTLTVDGEVVYKPTLVDLKIRSASLKPEGAMSELIGLSLNGDLAAEGEIYYNYALPRPQRTRVQVDIRASSIGLEGQRFGTMVGPLEYRNRVLQFGPFLLRNGGGNATLNGSLTPNEEKGSFLDMLVRTNRIELVAAPPEGGSEYFRGFVTGQSRIRGFVDSEKNPGKGIQGTIEANLRNFRAFNIPFQTADLLATYADRDLKITSLRALKDKIPLRMSGLLSPKGGSSLVFDSDPILISSIEIDPKLRIFSKGTVAIDGLWKPAVGWEVRGQVADAEVGGRSVGSGQLDVSGDESEFRLDLELAKAIKVRFRADTSGEGMLIKDLEAQMSDSGIYGGLAYLGGWIKPKPIVSAGKLSFRWTPTQGYFRTDNLQLNGPQGTSGLQATLLNVPAKQELIWENRQVVSNSLHWEGASRVDLSGSPGDKAVRAKGRIPLALMQLFIEGIGMKGGYIDLDATVPLSPNFSTLRATATMEEGILEVPGVSQPFVNARAELRMSNSQLSISDGRMDSGGGAVFLEGAYKLDFEKPGVSLNIRLDRAKTIILDDVPVDMSGSLQLRGEGAPYLLSGRVLAVNSLYTKEFAQADVVVEAPPEASLRFNVDVEIANSSRVRNSLISSGVSGRLLLQGDNVAPEIRGELDLSAGGSIFANQTEFRLIHGRVNLQGGADTSPIVNLRANTVVRYTNQDYRIELNARGPATALTLELASDPTLRQQDIVSLLAFGVIRSDEPDTSSGSAADNQIASAAQAEAFQALFGKVIGSNINRTTGFDVRLQASSAAARKESTMPKVTVMRRLGDRVTARFGRSLDLSSPEKDLQVDYRLLNNVNLTGVWESPTPEESSLGVDLRFKFDVK
jgi:hypothetical protein